MTALALDRSGRSHHRPVPLSVGLFPGYYMANSAARIGHIAFASRNQMNMAVHNGLTRNLSRIDADIEPFHRLILSRYCRLLRIK